MSPLGSIRLAAGGLDGACHASAALARTAASPTGVATGSHSAASSLNVSRACAVDTPAHFPNHSGVSPQSSAGSAAPARRVRRAGSSRWTSPGRYRTGQPDDAEASETPQRQLPDGPPVVRLTTDRCVSPALGAPGCAFVLDAITTGPSSCRLCQMTPRPRRHPNASCQTDH